MGAGSPRGKFLAALHHAFSLGRLRLSGAASFLAAPSAQRALLGALRAKAWVVYAKRPFAGPAQVLDYLGRYTHRAAISNERIVAMNSGRVYFRFKDYAQDARRRIMALEADEFLRRFALHILPRGFMRIRHYGLLANRNKRALLADARAALDVPAPAPTSAPPESVADFWQRVSGIDITRCTHCGLGTLHLIAVIAPQPRPPP